MTEEKRGGFLVWFGGCSSEIGMAKTPKLSSAVTKHVQGRHRGNAVRNLHQTHLLHLAQCENGKAILVV